MADLSLPVQIGVGLDTARYGHHASFLGEDRRPVMAAFTFPESRAGYEQLTAALTRLARRHEGQVHFQIRIDAAGQYAVNLEAFLRQSPFPMTISVGEPKRNKDYKNAHFPKRKADAVDSLACARFAIVERPPASPETPAEFLQLRELAAALQSQCKQTTRRLNVLHNRLARVFPELALLVPDLSCAWVLKLLQEFPTPARIAAARASTLARIPHLTAERAASLQAAAKTTTGSLKGEFAEALIQQAAAEVHSSQQLENRLQRLLEEAFDALPEGGHRQLLTIPGIGRQTAAALTAKIISIDRFSTPAQLVSYFGAFPEENSSGVDKFGRPVPPGTLQMSSKGNDLVRGLLWMACQSALRWNPAIRALYARQKTAGKRGDVALGHCLRKMLHLVFAVWKTNRPFDPQHFPWEHAEAAPPQPLAGPAAARPQGDEQTTAAPAPAASYLEAQEDAAGHKGQSPDRTVVTAASIQPATRNIPQTQAGGNPRASVRGTRINFAELRRQVSLTDVLRRLGVLDRLRGQGAQRRGPCPIHAPQSPHGRTFSVHLDKQVFRCLDPLCGAQGNVLDFWAALHKLPLRDAALHLAESFCPQLTDHHPPAPGNTPEHQP
jgi:transposase